MHGGRGAAAGTPAQGFRHASRWNGSFLSLSNPAPASLHLPATLRTRAVLLIRLQEAALVALRRLARQDGQRREADGQQPGDAAPRLQAAQKVGRQAPERGARRGSCGRSAARAAAQRPRRWSQQQPRAALLPLLQPPRLQRCCWSVQGGRPAEPAGCCPHGLPVGGGESRYSTEFQDSRFARRSPARRDFSAGEGERGHDSSLARSLALCQFNHQTHPLCSSSS